MALLLSRNRIGLHSKITTSIIIAQWTNATFTRPHIDPEWLGLCCRWIYDAASRRLRGRVGHISYARLFRRIIRQILGSNLSDSTIKGTGFRQEILPATGYLQGPPRLVQVIEMTEIVQSRKPRMIKLKLSDGDIKLDATVSVPFNCRFDFSKFPLGFKMFLKGTRLQNSVLILEPHTVALLGGNCIELEEKQEIAIQRTKRS